GRGQVLPHDDIWQQERSGGRGHEVRVADGIVVHVVGVLAIRRVRREQYALRTQGAAGLEVDLHPRHVAGDQVFHRDVVTAGAVFGAVGGRGKRADLHERYRVQRHVGIAAQELEVQVPVG